MIFIKNKPLVIILMIIAMTLLSLSAVSAADHTVSVNSFDEINNVASSVSPNDSILLDNNNYVPGIIKTINVNTDNVTIKGQSSSSKATLNAQGSDLRILIVRGNNVRLENLIFINADTDSIGSALYSSGANLTIVNCEFSNNRGYSGPILLENSSINVIIQDCIFSENTASPNTDVTGAAAAIDSHSSNGRFINCVFINNLASKGGEALYFIFGRNNTVINCNFINNSALLGGAIWLSNNGTLLSIIGSNFTNNKATDGNGGAIYSINPITISNSNFDSNYAKNNGGAIYASSSLRITGSSFKSNSAANGGGIYSTNALTLSATSGNNNQATTNGGFIYGTGTINIYDGIFNNNGAKSNGGAVYGTGTINVKNNSKFSSNTAINGGAIFSNNNLNIVSSNFSSNSATNGGAVYASKLTVDKGYFYVNVAKSNGGGVYVKGTGTIKNKSTFSRNNGNNGGAVYSLNTLSIFSSTLSNNIAKSNGGAIFSNKTFSISYSSLNNNNGVNGGAVYGFSTLSISSSTLGSNKAVNGGAVYSLAKLTIDKSTFSKNQANSNGGGLYAIGTTSIKGNSRFTSNSAYKGAAIFSNKNKMTISKTTFSSNDACIGLFLSLVDNVVKYGKSKLKVSVDGKFGNNIKVENDVPIWSNKITNVKVNGKKITKKYTLPDNSKFTIKVNGKSVSLNFKSKKSAYVEIPTTPNYNWKDFTFTATYDGKGKINKTTAKLKVNARISNTDVYNVDMVKKLTKKEWNKLSSNKKKYFKKYYVPYRNDTLQTKTGSKTHIKSIYQQASDNVYFLGGEKVPKDLQRFLWGYDRVVDVNNLSIKNRVIEILSRKPRDLTYNISGKLTQENEIYDTKGIITQEKKIRAIQFWVATNTHYIHSNPYLAHGGANALKRIYANPKGEHTNCVGFSNLFVSLARTAGVPVSQIEIPEHAIVATYSYKNGKWSGVMIEPQDFSGNIYPSKAGKSYQKGPLMIIGNISYYAIESVFGGARNGLGIPVYDYQTLLLYGEYYNFGYKPNRIFVYEKVN